ncbi:MAG: hypothetical protein S0880_27050 [Actinomycetota bacterium]|nr:hypothetical protein [Actinomycetota bacterium]
MSGSEREASGDTTPVWRGRLLAGVLVGSALLAGLVVVLRGAGDGDSDELVVGTTTTIAPSGADGSPAEPGGPLPTVEGPAPDGDPLIVDLPTDQLATIDGKAMAVERVCRAGDGALVYVGPGGRRVELGSTGDAYVRLADGDDVAEATEVEVSDHGDAVLYEAEVALGDEVHDVVALDTGHGGDAERCG